VRVAVEIVLSDDEVLELSKLSKSRSVSVRLAERSRIVLPAGKGMTNEEIGKELDITRQKAGRWRERYADNGVGGISQDAYRPGRKPKIGSRKVTQVIRLTTQETPKNATHWSQRLMARPDPGLERVAKANGFSLHAGVSCEGHHLAKPGTRMGRPRASTVLQGAGYQGATGCRPQRSAKQQRESRPARLRHHPGTAIRT
jgi:hypothetical protein